MWAEQAIFTSLTRRGKSGYHLVARSTGVTDIDAAAIATWSPSHGALIVDPANRTNVSFHPLPSGRFALSRTCQGPAEYSGRGGRQLYTHTLIIDQGVLGRVKNQPFTVLHDALALGHLHYRPEPEPQLRPVPMSLMPTAPASPGEAEQAALDRTRLASILERLAGGHRVEVPYAGDRALLAEYLIGLLPTETRPRISFATSLRPSMVRPFQLVLIDAAP